MNFVWHEVEFRDAFSFSYAMYEADGPYIGCAYLYPRGRRTELTAELLDHDVDVSWWVTPEEFPFDAVHYSNSEIPSAS